MPADYIKWRDECMAKKREKKGETNSKDYKDCQRQAAIIYFKVHGKPVPRSEGNIMIDKKDLETMRKFFKDVMTNLMIEGISEEALAAEKEKFADDENLIFPIDNKENLFKSAEAMNVPQLDKIYDDIERLYMCQKILAASNVILDNEKDREELRSILKGENSWMEKIYTKEEMIAEATRLAELKAKELTDANVKDEESQKAIDAANKLATEKEAEATEAKKLAAETQAKLDAIEKERAAEAAQREAEKLETEKKETATKRVKELADAGFQASKSSDILLAYISNVSETDFTNLKTIFAEVVEAAKQMMTPEEMQKRMDENKKKDKSKANLVEGSLTLPITVATDGNKFEDLDLAFASAFENKDGGNQ